MILTQKIMIFVNFKSYHQALGSKSVELAKICQKAKEQTDISIIPAVSTPDIYRCTQSVNIEIWAQHCDPKESSRNTGWITAESLKRAGASGVFINHSEHPLEFSEITEILKKVKKAGLHSLIFTPDLAHAKKADALEPDYLAYEPPELVAGGKAVVEFKKEQEKIKKFASLVKHAQPLTGAGIKSKRDVYKSLELGVEGVAVASGFVKSADPHQLLLDISKGFK